MNSTVTYKNNAQPFYVLDNLDGKSLNVPSAYNPDVKEYLEWLKVGVSIIKSIKIIN